MIVETLSALESAKPIIAVYIAAGVAWILADSYL